MKRFPTFVPTLFALLTIPQFGFADIVFEGFNYPVQSDSSGFDSGGGEFVYRITTTGSYGSPADTYIATFQEGFSSAAGIVDVGGGSFVSFFNTTAQSGLLGGVDTFVGITDIPGFGDTTPAGPFASFFSTPQNLSQAFGSIDVWANSGTGTTSFRLVALDAFDNEIATNLISFGTTSQTFGYTSADFVNELQGTSTDPTQIISVGIEFFVESSGSGDIDAFQFYVDNVSLNTIPEPGSFTLFGSGFVCWLLLRRKRR